MIKIEKVIDSIDEKRDEQNKKTSEVNQMQNFLIVLLLLIAGFGVSVQGTMNGGLGKTIGTTQAAFFSFLVGTLTLLFILLFVGKGNFAAIGSVPKWQLLGGFLGAFYVTVLAFSVPKIGIGLSTVTVVVSQILASLIIDHFGWFHSTQVVFNTQRMIGATLLIVGLIFIYRGT